MVHRLFPGRLRGRGQALYTVLGYGLSGVVGGVGGGFIIEYLGFQAAFAAAMCTAIAAWYCTRRMARCAPATPPEL
jgi:PPP family 3-phenylpropionic acid transporter